MGVSIIHIILLCFWPYISTSRISWHIGWIDLMVIRQWMVLQRSAIACIILSTDMYIYKYQFVVLASLVWTVCVEIMRCICLYSSSLLRLLSARYVTLKNIDKLFCTESRQNNEGTSKYHKYWPVSCRVVSSLVQNRISVLFKRVNTMYMQYITFWSKDRDIISGIFLRRSLKHHGENRMDEWLMFATIRDDTRKALNMQLITKNSKI